VARQTLVEVKTMTTFDIRLLETEAEREAAYRLRYELYVEDQGLFGDQADHERRWLRDKKDNDGATCLAKLDGVPVGTARLNWGGDGEFTRENRETYDLDAFLDIVDPHDMAVGSRMVVRPEFRGGVLVLGLFTKLWELAVARGIELIFAECEPHLINKWVRFGFRPYGLWEHPVNGTLVRLVYVLGDYDYAVRIGSPVAHTLRAWSKDSDAYLQVNEVLAHAQRVVSEIQDREHFWAEVERTLPRAELMRLLGGLDAEQLDALLGNSHALDCDPGACLIRKGHVSRTLYVLLTGSLLVRDEGVVVAEVDTPGAVLGEVAFFAGSRRMSDVIAGAQGARVLALSERNLRTLITSQGDGAAKFLHSLTVGLCTKLRQRARPPSSAARPLG
jgi:hypothetical protein